VSSSGPPSTSHLTGAYWLTILHTNDVESALLPAGAVGGVARFTTVVKQQQAAAMDYVPPVTPTGTLQRGLLTLSSGDNFLAGMPFKASLDKGPPYYDTLALEEIGFDAIGLGNHDFDFGPDVLEKFISGFTTPVPFLSANLNFSGEAALQALVTSGRIAKRTTITTGGQQVGIVGVTTTELPTLTSPGAVTVSAVKAALQAEVDALVNAGINKIVVISHLQAIANDVALVPQLRNVDIYIAGGGHELLANADTPLIPGDTAVPSYPKWVADADGHQVPIVTTSGLYRYVGRLVANFDANGVLLGVDPVASKPLRVVQGAEFPDAATPDTVVENTVVLPVTASIAALAQNVLAVSDVALDGRRANIRTVETNLGNLVADSVWWEVAVEAYTAGDGFPDVGIVNGGGIRNNTEIPAGNITEADTFTILPFSNFVALVPDVPRAQFKELLENAVSNVENSDGRFAQVSGFSYMYDVAGTAQVSTPDGTVTTPGTRVRNVVLDDGTVIVRDGVVQDGGPISVATIDFLARGGDGYNYRDAPFTRYAYSYQAALADTLVYGLEGVVSAVGYPVGGEGRIVRYAGIGGVDYPVITRGGRLTAHGTGFTGATKVTVGGTDQTFTVASDTEIVIPVLAATTPIGKLQPLVVTLASASTASLPVTVIHLLINEVDCDTPTTPVNDAEEFVEVSTGVPFASLLGYSLVFFNGAVDTSYMAMDLAAFTNGLGLVTAGAGAVSQSLALTWADNTMQNGADAVALYQTRASVFPNSSAMTTTRLVDAVVYGTGDAADTGLLDGLLPAGPGRLQLDEALGGSSTTNSIQRCGGAPLDGRAFLLGTPTPGAVNACNQ
jgi:5'-nucleotidase